jgi:hypothetical protein
MFARLSFKVTPRLARFVQCPGHKPFCLYVTSPGWGTIRALSLLRFGGWIVTDEYVHAMPAQTPAPSAHAGLPHWLQLSLTAPSSLH